jgi:hypothetical protein
MIERIVQIKMKNEDRIGWKTISCFDLKHGDMFRLFDNRGDTELLPVVDKDGDSEWIAVGTPYIDKKTGTLTIPAINKE